MIDVGDDWPLPDYNPGPQKHLHALGAISTNYNRFEARLFSLFAHHLDAQRLENINLVFSECEIEKAVKECVSKLILYFKWCYETRNHLLHSRHDPPLFGHDEKTLHLTKRVKKTSERGFLKLNLARCVTWPTKFT